MTYKEFVRWAKYRQKHGSLDSGRRTDRSLALIASQFAAAFIKFKDGRKVSPDDFTLYPEERKESREAQDFASNDDVINLIKSIAVKK